MMEIDECILGQYESYYSISYIFYILRVCYRGIIIIHTCCSSIVPGLSPSADHGWTQENVKCPTNWKTTDKCITRPF